MIEPLKPRNRNCCAPSSQKTKDITPALYPVKLSREPQERSQHIIEDSHHKDVHADLTIHYNNDFINSGRAEKHHVCPSPPPRMSIPPSSIKTAPNRTYQTPPEKNNSTVSSPQSVVTVSLEDENVSTPPRIRPVISTNETLGSVEVFFSSSPSLALCDNLLESNEAGSRIDIDTMTARPGLRTSRSLLDCELTPESSGTQKRILTEPNSGSHTKRLYSHSASETPQKQELDSCCHSSIGDVMGCDSTCYTFLEKIKTSLNIPSSMDNFNGSCHAWPYFQMERIHALEQDTENINPNAVFEDAKKNKVAEQENIQRVVQNRTLHSLDREQRLSDLRNDLGVFLNRESLEPTDLSYSFARANSFNDATDRHNAEASSKIIHEEVGCHPQSLWDWNMGSDACLPVIPPPLYDSDPEDFSRTPHRRIREIIIGENKDSDEDKNATASQVVDLVAFDEATVQSLVQDLLNQRMTLILHEDSFRSSGKITAQSPHAVHLWVERATYLNQGVLTPRLVWQSMNKMKLENQRLRVVFPKTTPLCSLLLLDIHRIVPLEKVDLRYARQTSLTAIIAKRCHCFVVQTHNRTLIFEVVSNFERDHTIFSLKLLVARLGSALVMDDNDILMQEFFAH